MQRSVRSEPRSGSAEQQAVAEERLAQLDEYETSDAFVERERVALRYADAVCWDPNQADDALWEQLHHHFTEPQLVELGFLCGIFAGGQRWIHTLQLRHAEISSDRTTGYRPELSGG